MEIFFQLLLVFILVLLNGYFVASEFSLVAVRKTRIRELVRKGRKRAKLVQLALQDIDTFISATQLGITIASIGLGWVGEPVLVHLIEPFLAFMPQNAAFITAHGLAILIAFSTITFLHIVFGELAPKTVALQRAESVSLWVIPPLLIFTKIFKPFIWVLNEAGNFVLKMFKLSAPSGHQLVHSEEEIKMILADSAEKGAIADEEAEMVYGVFRLGEIPVKQIMVPRTQVIAFNVAKTLDDVVKWVKDHPHSRFPVYENSIDTIIGFIHIKDVYKAVLTQEGNKKLSETNLIRKIINVSETKRIDEILLDIRRIRVHIATVKDEDGKTAGIVTLEDIIESLVGEIQDEFETPFDEKPIKKIKQYKKERKKGK